MAAPFSISKLLGVGVVAVIMIMIALPMIQQAFTPPGSNSTPSNTVPQVNCTTGAINANVSPQYVQAKCLIVKLYGYNNSAPNSSQYGYIFTLTNSTAFGKNGTSNSLINQTGFNSNIFQFTGLSFVFSGIGTIISTMEKLGSILALLFSTLWLWLPNFEQVVIVDVLKLVTFYVYIRLILVGIGAWMKTDLLSM